MPEREQRPVSRIPSLETGGIAARPGEPQLARRLVIAKKHIGHPVAFRARQPGRDNRIGLVQNAVDHKRPSRHYHHHYRETSALQAVHYSNIFRVEVQIGAIAEEFRVRFFTDHGDRNVRAIGPAAIARKIDLRAPGSVADAGQNGGSRGSLTAAPLPGNGPPAALISDIVGRSCRPRECAKLFFNGKARLLFLSSTSDSRTHWRATFRRSVEPTSPTTCGRPTASAASISPICELDAQNPRRPHRQSWTSEPCLPAPVPCNRLIYSVIVRPGTITISIPALMDFTSALTGRPASSSMRVPVRDQESFEAQLPLQHVRSANTCVAGHFVPFQLL